MKKYIYPFAIGLAALATVLGLWDVVVEQDGGSSNWSQVLLPAALLFLSISLYRRDKEQGET